MELQDAGLGRDRIETEHDGHTAVLGKETEVWRKLIGTREVACEKDGLRIKRRIARMFVRKLAGHVSRVGLSLGGCIST